MDYKDYYKTLGVDKKPRKARLNLLIVNWHVSTTPGCQSQ